MSMKKFCVPAIALILFALTLTACAFAPASGGTAYAADNEFYICVSPSDGVLAANETAQPSDIEVHADSASFYLTQGYYYKAVKYGADIYILDSSLGAGCYIQGAIPEDALLTSLPAGATAANALPDVTLTLADGAELTLSNLVSVSSSDTKGYTFKFLGWSDYSASDGTRTLAFSADNGAGEPLFCTAGESSFNAFTVPWHPVAAAEREALLAPETPEDTDDGDLTAGTPSTTLRIVLIIGIAVPALLIVFLLFKPTSDKNRGYDRGRSMRRDNRRGIDYDRERSYDADRDRYDRGYRDYERRDYPEDGRGYDYDRRDDDRRY